MVGARLALHRVAHRLFCRRCLIALRRGATPPAPPRDPSSGPDWAALRRWNALLGISGILAKSGFYLALFLWARGGGTGAAALHGFVAADIVTWIAFSVLEWDVRGFQIGIGAGFQLLVAVLYLARGEIFGAAEGAVEAGLSVLFFILFAAVKSAVWAAELVLESTGIKEPEPG